jgi:RsiW-degrading membrane proteinase PrsW (M82 family)
MSAPPPASMPLPAVAPPRPINWPKIAWFAGIVVLLVGCAVWLLLKLGNNIGPTGLVIGICAAILPVPFLIAAFMWLDRYEPEPTRYLAFCLLWGAFVATLIALFVNTGASALFKHLGLPQDLVAVLVAPVIEESMKALGPVLLLLFTVWKRRRTVNGIVDSIVFFGLSATGFAFSENILYLGGYGYDMGADKGGVAGGLQAVLGVFIGRIPLSGFAHPLFTSMTALGVGIAIRSTNRRVKIIAPIAGWFGAMLLHGSWNLMSVLAQDTGHWQILLYGYFAVFMPIFFAQVAFVMWLRSSEGRLTSTKLIKYVRGGWISPPEVASLASIGRRRSARAWAKRVAGKSGEDGMRGFQLAATQLALLRDRIDRRAGANASIDVRDTVEEQQLLGLVSAYRTAYVGRDPQTPPARWDGNGYHIAFPDGMIRVIGAPSTPVVPVPVVRTPVPAYGGYPPGMYPPSGAYPPGAYGRS